MHPIDTHAVFTSLVIVCVVLNRSTVVSSSALLASNQQIQDSDVQANGEFLHAGIRQFQTSCRFSAYAFPRGFGESPSGEGPLRPQGLVERRQSLTF